MVMMGRLGLTSKMTAADQQLHEVMHYYRGRVDGVLEHWLPSAALNPNRLHAAMRYSVLGSGKRIRPLLVYFAGQAVQAAPSALDGPACVVELIHAYSLIHDDLPAMDDDDLRRGQPTCHRAFDEATAILAGDALQALAFQILASDPAIEATPEDRLAMIHALANAAGSRGMAGGQAIDLAAVGAALDLAELEHMHLHKTGALIRTAVHLGALSRPGIAPTEQDALDRYAKAVGLAFQIRDDIIDIRSDTATLGKTAGKDTEHHKPTYVSLLGLDRAEGRCRELLDSALSDLEILGERAHLLERLARFIIERDH